MILKYFSHFQSPFLAWPRIRIISPDKAIYYQWEVSFNDWWFIVFYAWCINWIILFAIFWFTYVTFILYLTMYGRFQSRHCKHSLFLNNATSSVITLFRYTFFARSCLFMVGHPVFRTSNDIAACYVMKFSLLFLHKMYIKTRCQYKLQQARSSMSRNRTQHTWSGVLADERMTTRQHSPCSS